MKEETNNLPDQYEAFFEWCKANGFADVAECDPESVDVKRMDESIAAYGMSPNTRLTDAGTTTNEKSK